MMICVPVPVFLRVSSRVDGGWSSGQSVVCHSCTIFFAGSSCRFFPEMYPSHAVNFPPTFGSHVALLPVNLECFLGSMKASYTSSGVAGTDTFCLIVSVFAMLGTLHVVGNCGGGGM